MKTDNLEHGARGLTLIELLVVIFVIFLLALLFLPLANHRRPVARAQRINCINNLRQVGMAFRVWTSDGSAMFPMEVSATNGGTLELVETAKAFTHYQPLAKELATPRVLVCPADKQRSPATNFLTGFGNDKLSYFVGVKATATNSQMFLSGDRNLTNGIVTGEFLELTTNAPTSWTEDFHTVRGNICLADGSVQQFSNNRLREAIALSGVTNRLAMP
jgi:type II secretory pathway pseudopilin PulG